VPPRLSAASVALAALLLAGVTIGAAAAEDTPANALLARVNEQRAQHRLAPLALDERLAEAAQAHADDMAARGVLSHEGSDGARLDARLHRAGYRYRFAAENIAAGLPDPLRTVERWMESKGHRANILEKSATEAGIGYVELPYGDTRAGFRNYWVLVLARPL
jgi:uncharacterized protein YkwD